MKQSIEELKRILHTETCSCVVSGTVPFIGRKPGVADLLMLYGQEPSRLQGAMVADKVVGKAAATLMILGGVHEVYADLMSRLGAEWLEKYGIKFSASEMVDYVENRTHTGWCPMEMACSAAKSPEESLKAIMHFINENRKEK